MNHARSGGPLPRPLVSRILPVLGAIAISAAMLGLVELCFRALAIGAPAVQSRLPYQQVYLPVMVTSTDGAGRAVYRVGDRRIPVQQILRDKPGHGYRVFLFGSSAAAGLGYSPNAAITAHLQKMLSARMPDRTVEVVNLAIVALSSKGARVLVEDVCARYRPDLVVVYSGNNEFMEVHAERLAAHDATLWSRMADGVRDLHLGRWLLRLVHGGPRTPSLADQDYTSDVRNAVRHDIEKIDLTEADVADTVNTYADNLDHMVSAAKEHGVDVVLMTVPSNWRWRGLEDLDAGWLAELFGARGTCTAAEWPRAIELLDARVADSPPLERHEWLFKRAVAHERMGQIELARADYRAALDADPTRRRALDVANERVREVAARRGVPLVDAVEFLAARTETGILGFETFYDNVHLLPRSAALLAGEVVRVLEDAGRLSPDGAAATDAYVAAQVCRFERLQSDPLAVDVWLGLGFDVSARMVDRDLWKYDRLRVELDRRIAEHPDDAVALVYRGNFHFFRVGEEQEAERDYRRALELLGEQADVTRNLELLRARGRP